MGRVGWVWPIAVQPTWWLSMVLLGVLALGAGLLAERQRRATLVAVVQGAPAGTVIIQEQGRGGPAVQIYVGGDPGSAEGPEPGRDGGGV